MATRSYIGNYRGFIYCHWDEYPKYNGEILSKYYTDPKKVDELISLGDISILAPNLYPDPSKPHNFDNRQKDVVLAYYRDMEIEWEAVKPHKMTELFEKMNDISIEYLYYFNEDTRKWQCKDKKSNFKWVDIDYFLTLGLNKQLLGSIKTSIHNRLEKLSKERDDDFWKVKLDYDTEKLSNLEEIFDKVIINCALFKQPDNIKDFNKILFNSVEQIYLSKYMENIGRYKYKDFISKTQKILDNILQERYINKAIDIEELGSGDFISNLFNRYRGYQTIDYQLDKALEEIKRKKIERL